MSSLIRNGLWLLLLGLAFTATVGGNCESNGPVSAGEVLRGTVMGQVTVDGAGRPGVTVALRIGTTTIATTQTGSGGTYTFANVVTEAKTVAVTPPSGTTCDPTQRNVTVTGGGTTTANFACMTPPPQTGTVTGQVTLDGSGLAGVAVTLLDGARTIATTTTDMGGTYGFSNVAIGTKTVSIAQPSGANCSTTQLDVTLPVGGTTTANFACLRPRGTVTGQVTMDGAGVSGVAVTLRDGPTTIATTTTGQVGTYQFSNVALGPWTVSIAQPPGASCSTTQLNVTVVAGTATANFACTTPGPQTGTVTGQVTVDGVGVSGVTVTLRVGTSTIATTTTDQGGTYQFSNVALGPWTVSIAQPPDASCSTTQLNVTVPAAGVAIADFICTLPPPPPPTGTVAGLVLVDCQGPRCQGASGVRVSLVMENGTTLSTTSDEGFYRFSHPFIVGFGTVSITPPAGQHCPSTQQDVMVPAGGSATATFRCQSS
jgi:hypothetical protein